MRKIKIITSAVILHQKIVFGAVKFTKHPGIDNYKYSGHGIRFGRNVIIFGVDMSSSVYVDNKKKDILILSEHPLQGLDGNKLTAEKKLY